MVSLFPTGITTCVGSNQEMNFITLRILVYFLTIQIIPYDGGNTEVKFVTLRILVSFFTIEIIPYVGGDTEVTFN